MDSALHRPMGPSTSRPSAVSRVLIAVGATMILALLAGFYGIVNGAVETSQQRLAAEQRAADVKARCFSASNAVSDQALCALTKPASIDMAANNLLLTR